MRRLLFILIILLPIFTIAKPKKTENKKDIHLKRIHSLKQKYKIQQEKLKDLTEKRWNTRQKHVETKVDNKEMLEKLQQEMERLYSDVARAREELLARENALENEKDILEQKKVERDFFISAITSKKEKESTENLISFPIDQDKRMATLEKIDRTYSSKRHPTQKLKALIDYKTQTLKASSKIGIARRTFVPDNGETITAQVLRIGNCMAYAMNPDGKVFFLSSTGKLGENRFKWNEITNESMKEQVRSSFPGWIAKNKITADLPVDILQNKYSSTIIGGKQRTWKLKMREFVNAGGFIMYPLGIIVIWALLIIINRIIIYTLKYQRHHKFINEAITLLSNKEIDKAEKLAKKGRGVLARVLDTCLHHTKWNRESAEKSIKELLLTEIPKLDKHLDTLSVLAATAPLMGLLGTVTGMIGMFEAITRFGTGDPKLLAGGISEALITTQVGLSIAIPLLLVHNFLRGRRNNIQADMEMYAMKILNRLWPED